MSRNRRGEIKANLHFNNNDIIPRPDDPNRYKLFKIRLLVDSLQIKYKQIPFERSMFCVDKQIVPFKGTFALNNTTQWSLANVDITFLFCVITINQSIYYHCNNPTSGWILTRDRFINLRYTLVKLNLFFHYLTGASGNSVLRLIEHLPKNKNKYIIYIDNWFASPALFIELSNIGMKALGTIRLWRFPGLEFSSDKEMKKNGRGNFEEKKR